MMGWIKKERLRKELVHRRQRLTSSGHIDLRVLQDGLSIACAVQRTSTLDYNHMNIQKAGCDLSRLRRLQLKNRLTFTAAT
jgi:hypothetical protein